MVVGLPIDSSGNAAGVTLNRSTDGVTWQNATQAVGFDGQGYDKQWVVCDDTSTSAYYGNCYIEVDITSSSNEESMAVSSDGGVTWSALRHPADTPSGLGGQPLVQPNGTVVVPYSANGSAIRSFTSSNGGTSWTSSVLVSSVSSHSVAGGLRSGDGLPSAEIDGAGKVYVAWQDCRFRSGCPANDIVYSTSTNGTTWSAVARVPIDATTSGIDHFIPGLGVDKATSGATADIGVLLLLPQRQLLRVHLPTRGRLHRFRQRRLDLEYCADRCGPLRPVPDREYESGHDGRRLHLLQRP